MPFFSVVLPTHNRAGYLRDLLPRVLRQSFTDFELIVSDNASSDETPDVVRQFSDPRMTYIRRPQDIGPMANINACIALARGQYFVLNQDDDVLHQRFLERCHAAVRERTDVVMYAAPAWRGGEKLTRSSTPLIPAPDPADRYYVTEDRPIEIDGQVAAAKVLCNLPFAFPAVALRMDALRSIGGFFAECDNYGVDVVTLVRATLLGKCLFDPRFGAFYRMHAGNVSRHQRKQTRLAQHRLTRDRAVEAMQAAGAPWERLVRAELELLQSDELLHNFKQLAECGASPRLQRVAYEALVGTWPRSRLRLAQKLVSRVGLLNLLRYFRS